MGGVKSIYNLIGQLPAESSRVSRDNTGKFKNHKIPPIDTVRAQMQRYMHLP